MIKRHAFTHALRLVKRAIKKRIEKPLLRIKVWYFRHSLKVIVGSASTKQKGWIGTNYPLLDLTEEYTFSVIFSPASVDNFLAEHVWEHLVLEDGGVALANCFTYLKPGGVLRIAVPDGYHPDTDYIEQVRPGGYGPGADDHKVLYHCETLS